MLIPGVLDSTNNFVEHPNSLPRAGTVYGYFRGNRIMAGTDCGFGALRALVRLILKLHGQSWLRFGMAQTALPDMQNINVASQTKFTDIIGHDV